LRKAIWAILLLVLLIGGVYALVSVNIPGIIRVVRPSLTVTPTSFGTIELSGTGVLTGSSPLTITNDGDLDLSLTYSCACPTGITLSLSPLPGLLAQGATWMGTVTFTVDSTVTGGDHPIQLLIEG